MSTVFVLGKTRLRTGNLSPEDPSMPRSIVVGGDEAEREREEAGIRVVEVVAGAYTSALITEDGRVYTCGENTFGQLGHGHVDNLSVATLVSSLNQVFIQQVACGGLHTVMLSGGGKVYTCGYNNYGQLGHNDEQNRSVPLLVLDLLHIPIQQVAAGDFHTLALSVDKDVYSFGCGTFGQLGHSGYLNSARPIRISGLPLQATVQIAAGCEHSVILTDAGHAFSFGSDNFGQLGHDGSGDEQMRCIIPTKIKNLSHIRIAHIAAGGENSAFVSVCGSLYICGHKSYGHSRRFGEWVPQAVPDLKEKGLIIKQVSCGRRHALMLTETGEVFQVGERQGHTEYARTPHSISPEVFEDMRVVQVSAGYLYGLILAESKVLFYENEMVELLANEEYGDMQIKAI